MMTDDDEPVAMPVLGALNLEVMSVAALREYIAALEAEIERTRNAIAMKEKVRAGAEALFSRK